MGVFEQGNHAELMRNDKIYAMLVKLQATKVEEDAGQVHDEWLDKEKDKQKKAKKDKKEKSADKEQSGAHIPDKEHLLNKEERESPWIINSRLNKEERRVWLYKKMRKILNRALITFGREEVSDAIVQCLDDTIDDELHTECSSAQEDGNTFTTDSIAVLFSEVISKRTMSSTALTTELPVVPNTSSYMPSGGLSPAALTSGAYATLPSTTPPTAALPKVTLPPTALPTAA